MTKLLWDQVGERRYETGLDKGVLYLPDGSAVPWNGLTSVEEAAPDASTPYYYDGVKYLDIPSTEDFKAVVKAITFPDELMALEGYGAVKPGLYVDDQPMGRFGLSYRTLLADDVLGTAKGYRIHILYNLTVTPDDIDYASVDSSGEAIEFSWTVDGVPSALSGFKATAHIIIDTTTISSFLLPKLEDTLYGTATTAAKLPVMTDLMSIVQGELISIVDNGDGTWSATGPDTLITMLDATTFQIQQITGSYTDANTYNVSTTYY